MPMNEATEKEPELDKLFRSEHICKTFVETLFVNVNNEKLSDAEFRQFVRNTLTQSV